MFILLAALAATPDVSAASERFEACVALAASDPAKALDESGAWLIAGGGVLAQQCSGLAYAAQKRWLSAATAFEQAAKAAESNTDGRAARLWVLAGNAMLAAGEPAKAGLLFDAGIAMGSLKGPEAGEAHLDRARARYALKDKKAARSDLDAAIKLVPADPLVWLLSATLARADGDLRRAQTDIVEATKRAPDEASVALEAGNIAIISGAENEARASWNEAVKLGPASDAGKAAAAALAQLGAVAKP